MQIYKSKKKKKTFKRYFDYCLSDYCCYKNKISTQIYSIYTI